MNTRSCPNRVTKEAYLDSNDSINPIYQIRVKAFIDNPEQTINCAPIVADFGQLKSGEKSVVTISITNDDSTKSEIEIVEPPYARYIKKTELKQTGLKSGETTEIKFILSDKIPVGKFLTCITLEAKDKPESRMSISIKGKIVE